jgi:hypothetical protein
MIYVAYSSEMQQIADCYLQIETYENLKGMRAVRKLFVEHKNTVF